MDIRLGAVREEDITFSATGHDHSGGAAGSTLGINALRVDEQSAENAGTVTLVAGDTTIVNLPSMNVIAGDRIFVGAYVLSTKGATAGRTRINMLYAAGTATFQTYNDYTQVEHQHDSVASEQLRVSLAGMLKVTGSGTLTLRLSGNSLGSDSTIAAGSGQLHALVLRGTG